MTHDDATVLTDQDRAVRRRVESRHGAGLEWRRIVPPGSTSRLHLARDANGPVLVAKILSSARSFSQELRALASWAPRAGLAAPGLLDHDAALRLVVMTHVEGRSGEQVRPQELTTLFAAAGRWLGRLHALAIPDDDPVPIADALRARTDALARDLAEAGHPEEGHALGALARLAELLEHDVRVPCHRDFRPANWILRAEGGVADPVVLDFEHARLDHPLVDLVALERDVFEERPDLRDAFGNAYRAAAPGDALFDDVLDDRRRLVHALDAARALVWAHRRGDPTHARGALDRLRRLSACGR